MCSLPTQSIPEVNGHMIYAAFCLREAAPGPGKKAPNWIACYNPSSKKWSHVSSIPDIMDGHVLKGFSMVAYRNYILIIGGKLCKKEMHHVSDDLADLVDTEARLVSSVFSYDVSTGEWSNRAPLRTPRSDFACTLCDDKIYVAGGQSDPYSARGISLAEVYDLSVDEWSPLPNMYALRFKCVGVTWNGKIHVVGGFAQRPHERASPYRTERSSAEVFDPQTGKWEVMAQMWQLDVPPNQIVAVGGKLFSSGDCLKTWKGHIEAYNQQLNMWDEVERSSLKTHSCLVSSTTNPNDCPLVQGLYLTMAPIRSYIYFLGGYKVLGEETRTVSTVFVFDTTASATEEAWKDFEVIEEEDEKELCSHCCVVQLGS